MVGHGVLSLTHQNPQTPSTHQKNGNPSLPLSQPCWGVDLQLLPHLPLGLCWATWAPLDSERGHLGQVYVGSPAVGRINSLSYTNQCRPNEIHNGKLMEVAHVVRTWASTVVESAAIDWKQARPSLGGRKRSGSGMFRQGSNTWQFNMILPIHPNLLMQMVSKKIMCLFVILHFFWIFKKKYQQECGSRVASAGFRQSTSKASPKLSSLQSVGTLKTHGFHHRKPFGSLWSLGVCRSKANNCHCLGFSKPVRFPFVRLSSHHKSSPPCPPGMMMALPRLNLAPADLHPKGPRPRPGILVLPNVAQHSVHRSIWKYGAPKSSNIRLSSFS